MTDTEKVSLIGTLMAEPPVDGSTGLSLIGDQQFVINGKALNSVGIDLGGRNVEEYLDRHVSVDGVLQNRGSHDTAYFWPVVLVQQISEIAYSGAASESFDSEGLSLALSIQPAQFPRTTNSPTIRLVLTNRGTKPKFLEFKDRARVRFEVTELTELFGSFKELWRSEVPAREAGTQIIIRPNDSFQVSTALPAEGTPGKATYLLKASICEHNQYSIQTQFRVTA